MSGKSKPSSSRITLQHVAKLAGVAPITVSRVISRTHNVREATRIKIEKAIQQLQYRPHQAARSLAADRSYLIGAITNSFSHYYYSQLHRGAASACREKGYHLVLEEIDTASEAVAWYENSFHQMRYDGLIIPPPLSDEGSFLDLLDADGVPYVRIAPNIDSERSPIVRCDEVDGAQSLVEHLWAQGYRRFAIMTGPSDQAATRLRLQGFTSALARHGVSQADIVQAPLVWSGSFLRTAEQYSVNLFAQLSQPTALFAFNDEFAAALIRVALERGLRVPQDLAIAGFDGSEIGELTFPGLTTIRQPIADMAAKAVEMLISGTEEGAADVLFPVELEIRASTILS